jgi:hypothetical protein
MVAVIELERDNAEREVVEQLDVHELHAEATLVHLGGEVRVGALERLLVDLVHPIAECRAAVSTSVEAKSVKAAREGLRIGEEGGADRWRIDGSKAAGAHSLTWTLRPKSASMITGGIGASGWRLAPSTTSMSLGMETLISTLAG